MHGDVCWDVTQVPVSNSVRLAQIVGAELAIIDRCGHLPMEECPEEFLSIVEKFIQDKCNR